MIYCSSFELIHYHLAVTDQKYRKYIFVRKSVLDLCALCAAAMDNGCWCIHHRALVPAVHPQDRFLPVQHPHPTSVYLAYAACRKWRPTVRRAMACRRWTTSRYLLKNLRILGDPKIDLRQKRMVCWQLKTDEKKNWSFTRIFDIYELLSKNVKRIMDDSVS